MISNIADAKININVVPLPDDKTVTIGARYVLPHPQHRNSSSVSLHRWLLFARRVEFLSIHRGFPVLDSIHKLFQTYRNRRFRRRIFAAYVRTLRLCCWQFYGRAHIIRSRGAAASFLPMLFQDEKYARSHFFNAAIKRHPYLKFSFSRSCVVNAMRRYVSNNTCAELRPRMSDREIHCLLQ